MTRKTKWSNLPNAKHIDWVLQSVKNNPEEWHAADNAVWGAVCGAELDAAYSAAWDAAWSAVEDAIEDAAMAAVEDAVEVAVLAAVEDAVMALVAYDDIEHYFLSNYEELAIIAKLTNHPAAILLLPAVKARELIEQKNLQVA